MIGIISTVPRQDLKLLDTLAYSEHPFIVGKAFETPAIPSLPKFSSHSEREARCEFGTTLKEILRASHGLVADFCRVRCAKLACYSPP